MSLRMGSSGTPDEERRAEQNSQSLSAGGPYGAHHSLAGGDGARRLADIQGPLIYRDVYYAQAIKWVRGRIKYGPEFVGHPLEEFDDEMLDALNYVQEAKRRWGYTIPESVSEDLRRIRETVRSIYLQRATK
jgi:hypothetical protein